MREDGNFKTWIWAFAAGFLLALPMLYFDYGESDHPELDQAVRAVRFLSSPNQIKRSSFWMIQEEKTPGRFVEWMFSPLGSAVWAPPGQSTGLPPGAAKQVRGAAPQVPRGVRVVPGKPEPDGGRQVVVKADDARGMLVAEAYENPAEAPVFVKEWSFLKERRR
jgi:hypothetical protein